MKRLFVCFVYCAVAAGCGSGAGKKTTGTGGVGADGGFPNSDYCVSGSTLEIRSPTTEGAVVMTLKR